MVGKKEEFWINNKKGDFFKDSNETLLIFFFQQGYRDVLINKSVIESHLKLVHTHVGVVCEYNSNCTHIGFVPGYCLSQIPRRTTPKRSMETSMRTRDLH